MTEMLKLGFFGLHSLPDENAEHYNEERDRHIAHLLDEIAPFMKDRLPEKGTDVTFVKGDDDGPYFAKPGKSEGTADELRKWLTAVYDVCMDCYGEETQFSVSFRSFVEVKWSDSHGQFSVELYLGQNDDVAPDFTFYVCENSEEPM